MEPFNTPSKTKANQAFSTPKSSHKKMKENNNLNNNDEVMYLTPKAKSHEKECCICLSPMNESKGELFDTKCNVINHKILLHDEIDNNVLLFFI